MLLLVFSMVATIVEVEADQDAESCCLAAGAVARERVLTVMPLAVRALLRARPAARSLSVPLYP